MKEEKQEKTMDDKKTLIVSTIAIIALVIIVVGATFAYFQAQGGDSASTDVTVTTSTSDSLAFSVGDEISFTATQSNFASGEGSLSGSTTATASLLANSATNSATYYYNIVLSIDTNGFEYTTDDSTAELILTVTDPDGTALTTISGLSYVTVTDGKGTSISGFDITGVTEDIIIASSYAITSTSSSEATEDTWNITVTFVNLDSDQEANTNKSFEGTVTISKAE